MTKLHYFRLLILASLICMPFVSKAQSKQMVIYRDGRTPLYISVDDVDSILFADNAPELHDYVDLGLSTLWATTNIGASQPEGYGYYFAWGETKTKESYTADNYLYATEASLPSDISATQYDAATTLWQGEWRMPTIADIDELTTKCTWTWTSLNGINGYRVVGPSGNHIFLPAAGQWRDAPVNVGSTGYYWSSTVSADYPTAAYNLNFTGYSGRWTANRAYGFSIRPVMDK